MKKSLLFLFPILLFSACANFYHLHYPSLKKVHASGFVDAPKIFSERKPICKQNQNLGIYIPKPDSLTLFESKSKIVSIDKNAKQSIISTQKTVKKTKQITNGKKEVKSFEKRQHANFFSASLVLLVIMIVLALLITGGWVLVIGIVAAIWWRILIGVLLLLLGIAPILFYLLTVGG